MWCILAAKNIILHSCDSVSLASCISSSVLEREGRHKLYLLFKTSVILQQLSPPWFSIPPHPQLILTSPDLQESPAIHAEGGKYPKENIKHEWDIPS